MTPWKIPIHPPIKLLDSTMVTLAMSLYDWAHYSTSKGAVKMHTLLDYESLLPKFVTIGTGKCMDDKNSFDIPTAPVLSWWQTVATAILNR